MNNRDSAPDMVLQTLWLSLQSQKNVLGVKELQCSPHTMAGEGLEGQKQQWHPRIWLSSPIAVKPGSSNRNISMASQGSHRKSGSSAACLQTLLSPNCHNPSPWWLWPNPSDKDGATWKTTVMPTTPSHAMALETQVVHIRENKNLGYSTIYQKTKEIPLFINLLKC